MLLEGGKQKIMYRHFLLSTKQCTKQCTKQYGTSCFPPRVVVERTSSPAVLRLFARHELSFYSPEGHHAAFALPPVALRELKKPPPVLRDTTADLEEIMAYGEESELEENTSGSFGHQWEPEVGVLGVLSHFKRRVSQVIHGVSLLHVYRSKKTFFMKD